MKRVVIIGAGPAGLTAAKELLAGNEPYDITILEESSEIGGISRTVRYEGNRMDIGGHRFFSKSDEIMQRWAQWMPLQGAPSFDDARLGREKPLEMCIRDSFAPWGAGLQLQQITRDMCTAAVLQKVQRGGQLFFRIAGKCQHHIA